MDPITVQTAISGAISIAAHTTTVIRAVVDKVKASGRSEMLADVLELQLAMMELIQKQQELLNECDLLRRENQRLTEQLNIKANLRFHHDAYWSDTGNDLLDGPFSRSEWDVNQRLVRLQYWDLWDSESPDPRIQFRDHKSEDMASIPFSFLNKHCPTRAAELAPKLAGNRRIVL